jgi:trk system potassium uptake protein TrkH
MLLLEALLMAISTGVAAILGTEDIAALALSTSITAATGIILRLIYFQKHITLDKRTGYLAVALIWIIVPVFGTLPFVFGGYISSYTDIFFETVSGFTTTGATILDQIEALPKGILFWRSIIQWIGGIGIVVVVVSLIQIEGGGAISLFSAEMVGPDKGKITPNTKATGRILVMIYSGLTLLCALSYWIGGMSVYDAFCHSFTTVSSGGFSTKDASASAFSIPIQYLMMIFMIPAGTNFILMYNILKGRFSRVRRNEEFRLYLFIIIFVSLFVAAFIYTPTMGLERTLREAFFQVISIITTTGYTNADYGFWATPAVFMLFVLMFMGAMSGSTSGGLKLIRTIVLFKNSRNITKATLHNKAVLPLKIEKHILPYSVIYNVLAVFLLYIAVFVVATLLLIFFGLTFEEALEGCLSCLGCVGPIYVQSETYSTFSTFPDVAKWIFSALMYLGRLEIITVFAIFVPSFWKR